MRLIDADIVDKLIAEKQAMLETNDDKMWESNKRYHSGLAIARRIIADATTIEAEPVRHGRWINEKSDIGYCFAEYDYECSLCGGHTGFGRYPQSRYCPNCGAKMDEVDE